jgi:hypothetical protein
MTTWRKVQGDVNDTITVILSGVENLTGATAVAKVWRRGVDAENLTTSITSTVNRTVSVDLGGASGWLFDAAIGTWLIEIQVTFADGSILTWPADSPDMIVVRADA